MTLTGKLNYLEQQISTQNSRIVNLEVRVRKRNLLWFGVNEVDEEEKGVGDVGQLVDLISSRMEVPCNAEDFEDVYRLGKSRRPEAPRPICIELKSVALKWSILRARKMGHVNEILYFCE